MSVGVNTRDTKRCETCQFLLLEGLNGRKTKWRTNKMADLEKNGKCEKFKCIGTTNF